MTKCNHVPWVVVGCGVVDGAAVVVDGANVVFLLVLETAEVSGI